MCYLHVKISAGRKKRKMTISSYSWFSCTGWFWLYSDSLRSRRLEVAGERENGRARGRHARSPSRAPVFSWAHYFQAPATQANTLSKHEALHLVKTNGNETFFFIGWFGFSFIFCQTSWTNPSKKRQIWRVFWADVFIV